jgi:hypothetical protein
MSDTPKDPFAGKNPTDPKGLNPPPDLPRSTGVEPPVVAVTFSEPCLSYNTGETAAFAPDVAKQLVEDGVAGGDAPKGRADPPHSPAPPHKGA